MGKHSHRGRKGHQQQGHVNESEMDVGQYAAAMDESTSAQGRSTAPSTPYGGGSMRSRRLDNRGWDNTESFETLKVFVRPRAVEDHEESCISISENRLVLTKRNGGSEGFRFDHVFTGDSTNQDVFLHVDMQAMIDQLVAGHSCNTLAYGATGTGKTFTLLGTQHDPGLVPLALDRLFLVLRRSDLLVKLTPATAPDGWFSDIDDIRGVWTRPVRKRRRAGQDEAQYESSRLHSKRVHDLLGKRDRGDLDDGDETTASSDIGQSIISNSDDDEEGHHGDGDDARTDAASERSRASASSDQSTEPRFNVDAAMHEVWDDVDFEDDGADAGAAAREYRVAVAISVVEFYNNQVYDMLGDPEETAASVSAGRGPAHGARTESGASRRALPVKQARGKFFVKGATQLQVMTANEAKIALLYAQQIRQTAQTRLNAASSRGHMMIMTRVYQVPCDTKGRAKVRTAVDELKYATMTAVDLAGCEKASKTLHSSGARQTESSNINSSLLTLGKCVTALREREAGKTVVVPYRDSNLTKMLGEYFEGVGRAVLIATLRPSTDNTEETRETLAFAMRTGKLTKGRGKTPRAGGPDAWTLPQTVSKNYRDDVSDEEDDAATRNRRRPPAVIPPPPPPMTRRQQAAAGAGVEHDSDTSDGDPMSARLGGKSRHDLLAMIEELQTQLADAAAATERRVRSEMAQKMATLQAQADESHAQEMQRLKTELEASFAKKRELWSRSTAERMKEHNDNSALDEALRKRLMQQEEEMRVLRQSAKSNDKRLQDITAEASGLRAELARMQRKARSEAAAMETRAAAAHVLDSNAAALRADADLAMMQRQHEKRVQGLEAELAASNAKIAKLNEELVCEQGRVASLIALQNMKTPKGKGGSSKKRKWFHALSPQRKNERVLVFQGATEAGDEGQEPVHQPAIGGNSEVTRTTPTLARLRQFPEYRSVDRRVEQDADGRYQLQTTVVKAQVGPSSISKDGVAVRFNEVERLVQTEFNEYLCEKSHKERVLAAARETQAAKQAAEQHRSATAPQRVRNSAAAGDTEYDVSPTAKRGRLRHSDDVSSVASSSRRSSVASVASTASVRSTARALFSDDGMDTDDLLPRLAGRKRVSSEDDAAAGAGRLSREGARKALDEAQVQRQRQRHSADSAGSTKRRKVSFGDTAAASLDAGAGIGVLAPAPASPPRPLRSAMRSQSPPSGTNSRSAPPPMRRSHRSPLRGKLTPGAAAAAATVAEERGSLRKRTSHRSPPRSTRRRPSQSPSRMLQPVSGRSTRVIDAKRARRMLAKNKERGAAMARTFGVPGGRALRSRRALGPDTYTDTEASDSTVVSSTSATSSSSSVAAAAASTSRYRTAIGARSRTMPRVRLTSPLHDDSAAAAASRILDSSDLDSSVASPTALRHHRHTLADLGSPTGSETSDASVISPVRTRSLRLRPLASRRAAA